MLVKRRKVHLLNSFGHFLMSSCRKGHWVTYTGETVANMPRMPLCAADFQDLIKGVLRNQMQAHPPPSKCSSLQLAFLL